MPQHPFGEFFEYERPADRAAGKSRCVFTWIRFVA